MNEEKEFELNKPDEVADRIMDAECENERKDAPVNGEDQAFKNGESLEDRVKLLSPGRLVAKRFSAPNCRSSGWRRLSRFSLYPSSARF